MKTLALLAALFASAVCATAANPYLHLPDEKPMVVEFIGEEWDQDRIGIDDKAESAKRAKLAASVTLFRLETMSWGGIYRISFKPVPTTRELRPLYLLVTDNEILQLTSEDMDREVRIIRAMKKQPEFEKGDVVALSTGSLKHEEGLWTQEVKAKGDTCRCERWHEGAGHFTTLVWKKGAGLIEIASGMGADRTGYRLKTK